MNITNSGNAFRIASYNIRKAVGLDRKRNPRRVLDVVNGLDADLVVLQEADLRLGQRPPAIPRKLIEQNTGFDLVPAAGNGISIGWHGNAVLIRRGMRPASVVPLELPGLEPRGAVLVEVAGPAPITVVAVHLGLTRNFRRRQLQTICENIDNPRHTIIAGDFNEWSQKRGLEPLLAQFNILSPGKSFHSAFPVASLDRFALGEALVPQGSGVETGELARQASDHLPVWVDITV